MQASLHRASRVGQFLPRPIAAARYSSSSMHMTAASAFNFPIASRGMDCLIEEGASATAIIPVSKDTSETLLQQHQAVPWAAACKFKASSGELLLLSGASGVSKVLLGVNEQDSPWAGAALAKLPAGSYQLELGEGSQELACKLTLGFLLGCYTFSRYKKRDKGNGQGSNVDTPHLVWPEGVDRQAVSAMAAAVYLARDLITTPAEDMGPQHLVAEIQALAAAHQGATIRVLQGDELLHEMAVCRGQLVVQASAEPYLHITMPCCQNYPAIHTVGRASCRPPALVDVRWSPPGRDAAELPLLALVGKGVCFDTGGLNIKPASSMKSMKKDMGGAALVAALGHLVMSHKLPVRLRLLVPAVENSISGNAFRPLDVLQTRAGITVENGNTDAEGRLILCDALADAASEGPDLLVDVATLTGAARAALGADIPAVFSTDDEVWAQLESASQQEDDPLWRMPLFRGYRKYLDSKVADLSSTGSDVGAGAIIAALYLSEFVKDVPRWLHIDTGAWNRTSTLGRPEGGEALGLRALWTFLQSRYQS